MTHHHTRAFLGALVLSGAFLTVGCGTSSQSSSDAVTAVKPTPHGTVHGGQQPVSGAAIQLYAVGTTGYGSASTPLLSTSVSTGPNGSFTITGDYSCSGNPLVYMVASGGNPGLSSGTPNSAIVLLAALGSCNNLTSSTNIDINELTTVAAVWSLAPFMTDSAHIGSSATNPTGITNAFATAAKLVDTATGTSPGAVAPSNATLPVTTMNTLADILASCVNSSGGSSGDGSSCGTLFANSSIGGVPTDTSVAAVHMAKNPALNASNLYGLMSADSSPFQPTLSTSPNDWTLSVSYTGGGLNKPAGLAVDANGHLWMPNPIANSVSEFDNNGNAISTASGFTGLNAPYALAIDTNGYVWIANSGNNSLVEMSGAGTVLNNFTGGGLNQPRSIALDASGTVWLGNKAAATVSGFSNAGTPLSSGFSSTSVTSPGGLVVDPQ
jgi:hypothetical protein